MKKNITLTQKEFVRRITGTTGMKYDEAERIVQIVVKEMVSCLLDGIGIKFRGLGTFMVKSKMERVFMNPITKIVAMSSQKVAVKFKSSRKLRERISKNNMIEGGTILLKVS